MHIRLWRPEQHQSGQNSRCGPYPWESGALVSTSSSVFSFVGLSSLSNSFSSIVPNQVLLTKALFDELKKNYDLQPNVSISESSLILQDVHTKHQVADRPCMGTFARQELAKGEMFCNYGGILEKRTMNKLILLSIISNILTN